jgi:hypothetical protein
MIRDTLSHIFSRLHRKELSLKRLVVLLIAILAFAVAASPASSATPQTKRIAALEKRVKTLEKQIGTLQIQVKTLGYNLVWTWAADACATAMTADLFQSTWTVLDTKLSPVLFGPVFGPQTPISDYDACSDLELTRTPLEALPTFTALNGLMSLLWGPDA